MNSVISGIISSTMIRSASIIFLILEASSQYIGATGSIDDCALQCNCTKLDPSTIRGNSTGGINEYHPVVLIHGINKPHEFMDTLMNNIKKIHKGTRVFNLDCAGAVGSALISSWNQVEMYGQEILAIGKAFPDGIHLIGYSQGGLIGRAVLQKFPRHNVRNFISLSAPQLGVYQCHGGSDFKAQLACLLFNSMTKLGSRFSNYVIKLPPGQMFHSYNYTDLYLNVNDFLPVLNKEILLPQKSKFKNGLAKLNLMVLIGGPDDEIVDPWQSAHFEFFERYDGVPPIVPLPESELYKKDFIGLKTLDKSNRLIKYTVPGVMHLSWPSNQTVINHYILPNLD